MRWDSLQAPPDIALKQLLWLAGRGPVRRAKLFLQPDTFGPDVQSQHALLPIVYMSVSLGAWSASLQRLSIRSGDELQSLGFLNALQQLTWLRLDVNVLAPPHEQRVCVSALQRLRTLYWSVRDLAGEEDPDEVELSLPPLLPTGLEQLALHFGNGQLLDSQLPALVHLQTLEFTTGVPIPTALPALPALTALLLPSACSLPSGLSLLPRLRYLSAGYGYVGDTLPSDSLQQLERLPQLEFLFLHGRNITSMAPLDGCPMLRALDVTCDSNVTFHLSACWLATLDHLQCG